jgi:hypothetical protein
VNYTAALLIACACEALAWFRYGDKYKGDQFLSEMMLPSQWQPAAKSLYGALRNGLAHAFETMTIVIGPRQIEIGVDWGRHTHLTFDPTHSLLNLNIFTMAEDLEQVINRYEEELKTSGEARAKFHETIFENEEQLSERCLNKPTGTTCMGRASGIALRISSGCSKRPSNEAAGELKPEAYPQGYVEDFNEPRTKLGTFFSSRRAARYTLNRKYTMSASLMT